MGKIITHTVRCICDPFELEICRILYTKNHGIPRNFVRFHDTAFCIIPRNLGQLRAKSGIQENKKTYGIPCRGNFVNALINMVWSWVYCHCWSDWQWAINSRFSIRTTKLKILTFSCQALLRAGGLEAMSGLIIPAYRAYQPAAHFHAGGAGVNCASLLVLDPLQEPQ